MMLSREQYLAQIERTIVPLPAEHPMLTIMQRAIDAGWTPKATGEAVVLKREARSSYGRAA